MFSHADKVDVKAYSTDLRKRVLAAWDCGQYMLKDIARMFSVSERWILLLRRLREQTGGIEPRLCLINRVRGNTA